MEYLGGDGDVRLARGCVKLLEAGAASLTNLRLAMFRGHRMGAVTVAGQVEHGASEGHMR